MTPKDEARMSQLLGDAAFLEYPLHAFIVSIKMLLYLVGFILLCVAIPVYTFFHGVTARNDVNESLKGGRQILLVDWKPSTMELANLDLPSIDGEHQLRTVSIPFAVHTQPALNPLTVSEETTIQGDGYHDENILPVQFCQPSEVSEFHQVTTLTQVPEHWFAAENFTFIPRAWVATESVPMYQAYMRAAYTIAAMHRALAADKTHDYVYPDPCDVDNNGNVIPHALTAAEASIHTPSTPTVELAYTTKEVDKEHFFTSAPLYTEDIKFLIMGMCLKNECEPEDFEYAISRGFTGPAFTEHQQRAMDALNRVGSDAYWLSVAHANGLPRVDDFLVLMDAERVRKMVDDQITGAVL